MKKIKQLSILLLVFAIILTGTFSACKKKDEPKDELSEQLSLGEKYLGELDYEQALACFLKAIEIDDKNVEAYIGAADAYIGLERPEDARTILEKGYEITGDERIQVKLEEIKGGEDIFFGMPQEVKDGIETYKTLVNDYDSIADNYESNLSVAMVLQSDKERENVFSGAVDGLKLYIDWIKDNKSELDNNDSDKVYESDWIGLQGAFEDYLPSLGNSYSRLIVLYKRMFRWDKCLEVRNEAANHFNDSSWNSGFISSAGNGYIYDEAGRPIALTDETGLYEYDESGLKLIRRIWIISEENNAYQITDFKYDESGKMIKNASNMYYNGEYVADFSDYIEDHYVREGEVSQIIYDLSGNITNQSTITFSKYGQANYGEWVEVN